MKKLLLTVVAAVMSVVVFAGPKVSILGDSYSTYPGAVPKGNALWYDGKKNGVDSVDKTWWAIAIKALGGQLEKCEAFSGATISTTGYGGADYTDRSFVTRATRLGNPDIILVCGATNDSWANSPLGEMTMSDWTAEDLKSFRPAMTKLLNVLKTTYPKAKVYFILNDGLKPEINEWVHVACGMNKVRCVDLKDVAKEAGHPNAAGMIEFARQVVKVVDPKCLDKVPAPMASAAVGGDADHTFVSDGFSCVFTDAGTIRNLTYKGKKIANTFFQLAGDAKLGGSARDARLAYTQEKCAKGAKITKNDDGTMTAVAEFPVKGQSGSQYLQCKVTTTVGNSKITVDCDVTRSGEFKFGSYLARGECEWPLEMMAGSKVDFEAWDGKHTVKEMTAKFTKGNNDNPGCVKTSIHGNLGDWELAVSGGYFCDLNDMRKWGGNSFKHVYVGQQTIVWDGSKNAPERSAFGLTMRACDKLDEAAIAKAKAEQKKREEEEAAAKAAALKPIIADFPSRDKMWNLADAGKIKTAARDKISLNGLWAFKVDNDPADLKHSPAVAGMKNFFKVPGKWPAGTHKWAKNGMAIYNENGSDAFGNGITKIDSAWYGRKVSIPSDWNGRRVILGLRWVPNAVFIYVDGAKAGEVIFPGGEVDLTAKLTPGEHEIAFFTTRKVPEKMVQVFDAPDQARTVSKKEIANPGIHGDVYIAAEPDGVKIDDVQVRSFVKDGKIDLSLGFTGSGSEQVTAVAEIAEKGKVVKTIKSKPFTANAGERFVFGDSWKGAKVWDVDCPENLYTVKVRLDKGGKAIDEIYPEEFGFREVTVSGRNLLLNGKPLHLRPEYSRMSGASAVSNDEAEEAYRRMRKHGFNFEIDGGYGFSEGILADFEFSIIAASKVGMPSVCGLPHPCDFAPPDKPLNWNLDGRYQDILKYEIKRLQNIPGLILWSSTHNQTGYESDQNPEIMTGKDEDVPDGIIGWRKSFRNSSKKVNKIMGAVDPTRPLYHHESGKNGEFYTLNCYLDWAPIQERSDWLEKWESDGVMPLFIVEWGAPHIASWASYRGEDNGRNIWSARGKTVWAWVDEFNCAFLGEEAFIANDVKKRWHELVPFYCKGNKPNYYGGFDQITTREMDSKKVTAMYMRRNLRDMRARGITMILPWDIETTHFKWPEGAGAKRVRENPLAGIKDFGVIRSDYSFGYLNLGGQIPALTGETMIETYTDIIGWISGPMGKNFTYVNDTFRKGEKVQKSLMIVNDCRKDQKVDYAWKAGSESGKGSVTVKSGERAQIPVEFTASESCTIEAGFKCADNGFKYRDTFAIKVVPAKVKASVKSVALFDPEGTAKPVLDAIGVKSSPVTSAPKSGILVIGRNAYSKLPFALSDVLAAGVKVVMLEQNTDTLKKLGFRIQEHGLRNLFANDPEFASLDVTDWRGDATMLPWYIGVDKQSGDFPRWQWEGFKHTRVWRAGNRGIVSCALPEKPSRGDFRALLSGGFNLQYAPLMEYSAKGQRMIFSQLDICGRSEPSPEAEAALAKILDYADRPIAGKSAAVYVMEGQGKVATAFNELGIAFQNAASATDAKAGDVLVLGPGAKPGDVSALVKKGVKVLALGLKGSEVNAAYPAAKAVDSRWESFPDLNPYIGKEPLFTGVSNADIQWIYPECMAGMAKFDEKNVLKAFHDGDGVFVANAVVPWQFDTKELPLRHNRRRAQALVTRLVCNLGGASDSGFAGAGVKLYADKPESIDDPYRYFRW